MKEVPNAVTSKVQRRPGPAQAAARAPPTVIVGHCDVVVQLLPKIWRGHRQYLGAVTSLLNSRTTGVSTARRGEATGERMTGRHPRQQRRGEPGALRAADTPMFLMSED